MQMSCLVTGLSLLFATPLAADPPAACRGPACSGGYTLHSVAAAKSYGLLLAAPDEGCRRVRYRVETQAAQFVGHTPPLGPGEVAVVRLGSGYASGQHRLRIAAEGCRLAPALARRVTLRKPGPDHGWRASS